MSVAPMSVVTMSAEADLLAGRCATLLRDWCDGEVPKCALLLGSGWSTLTSRLQVQAALSYAELPGFLRPTVAGHAGRLLHARLPAGGAPLLVLSGRCHAYEQGDAGAMGGAVRALAAAGVRTLVQTSAVGSLQPAIGAGHLVLVSDHLNLVQRSPLLGDSGDGRFVDLSDAYDAALRERVQSALQQRLGARLPEGVLAWMLGPQFETPAEIRMLQRLGADLVGMSCVPETILARRYGLRVLALALVTNLGCGLGSGPLGHAQTLAAAHDAADRACERLLVALQVASQEATA